MNVYKNYERKLNSMKESKKSNLMKKLKLQVKKFNKKSDRKLKINFDSNNISQYTPNNQYQNMNNNMNNMQYQNMNNNMQYQNMNNQDSQMNQDHRKLFLGGLVSSIGGVASQAAGGLGNVAKSVTGGLTSNGGLGAGLLGAGAGMAMAFGGQAKEREEISNLEMDLRTKEMRYQMERGKKQTELDELDRRVNLLYYVLYFLYKKYICIN